MKKKILCIIVCTLVATTGVFLVSGSETKNKISVDDHAQSPSGETTTGDNTVELSIRGGLGKCEFIVYNNGTEAVLAYASVAVGGIMKSNDQIGFPVSIHEQKSVSIYKVRTFAPIQADLTVEEQTIKRTGFIIGIFVFFTQ